MFTIGADPELLLRNQQGQLVSAEGLTGGTKEAPVPILGMEELFEQGFAMQEDNVMLEYNLQPMTNVSGFVAANRAAITNITKNLLNPNGLTIHPDPVAEYDPSYLQSEQAMRFGCAPDQDAYSGGSPSVVRSPSLMGNHRMAGGHIHIGFDNPANIPTHIIVQLADMLIGLTEVRISNTQGMRREYYGTAGRYRQKPYGIEYRTPSNRWVFDTDLQEKLGDGAWRLATRLENGQENVLHELYTSIPPQEVRNAINTEDRDTARRLYREINQLESSHGY